MSFFVLPPERPPIRQRPIEWRARTPLAVVIHLREELLNGATVERLAYWLVRPSEAVAR